MAGGIEAISWVRKFGYLALVAILGYLGLPGICFGLLHILVMFLTAQSGRFPSYLKMVPRLVFVFYVGVQFSVLSYYMFFRKMRIAVGSSLALSAWCFFRTSLIDPGYFEENEHQQPKQQQAPGGWAVFHGGSKPQEQRKDYPDNAYYCKACQKYVVQKEHHCPLLNNCIGFRNYRYFVLMLLYASSAHLLAFPYLWRAFNVPAAVYSLTQVQFIRWAVLCVFFDGLYIIALFTLHVFLFTQGCTMIESLEGKGSSKSLQQIPFSPLYLLPLCTPDTKSGISTKYSADPASTSARTEWWLKFFNMALMADETMEIVEKIRAGLRSQFSANVNAAVAANKWKRQAKVGERKLE